MLKSAYFWAAVTALANIALNIAVRFTATRPKLTRYRDALTSPEFLVAFLIGSVSLLCLLAVHRSGFNFSQAIIMMGAISILGGALFGIATGSHLTVVEIGLLVTIGLLFVYRYYRATQT